VCSCFRYQLRHLRFGFGFRAGAAGVEMAVHRTI
jgi:hypothetical protein